MTFTLNGTAYPLPKAWAETYETIENVNQSEAGTDLCSLIRANKLSLSINSNVTEAQKNALLALSALATISVGIGVNIRTMRMRNFTADRVRYSEKLETGELWEVAYTLIEI